MSNSKKVFVSMVILSMGLLLSFSVYAGKSAKEKDLIALQIQIKELQEKIDNLSPPAIYAIGDILPDSGIVFYVDDSGKRGLAAWPHDEQNERRTDVADNFYFSVSVHDRGLGWRLPFKNELNMLYIQRDIVGGFIDDTYWSSNLAGLGGASWWVQDFSDGSLNIFELGIDGARARAVREF